MSISFRPARREDVQLIIGLAGSSGSGKTMSALKLARGLAGDKPFALIDTERGRALHYGDDFQPWHHAELNPPFRPDAYAEAITAADEADYPVIVVDSFSHEHAGDGGLLDWHAEEVDRMGGDDYRKREAVKIAAWIAPKSSHKRLVSKLLQVRAHLIICLRAEQQIEISKDAQGKTVIRPKKSLTGLDGWVPIAEKSLAYELTANFLLTADAPGVPKPIKLPEKVKPFFPLDQPIGEEAGKRLAEWAAGSKTGPVQGPAASDPPEREPDTGGASTLAEELIALSDKLGADARAAIEANRLAHADEPALHVAWLERQVETAEMNVRQKQEAAA